MNESRAAHLDAQHEQRLRQRAEEALRLESEREEHIRSRERDHERERVIHPLLETKPRREFQTPIRTRCGSPPVERMDLPGEHGEEFGGVIY